MKGEGLSDPRDVPTTGDLMAYTLQVWMGCDGDDDNDDDDDEEDDDGDDDDDDGGDGNGDDDDDDDDVDDDDDDDDEDDDDVGDDDDNDETMTAVMVDTSFLVRSYRTICTLWEFCGRGSFGGSTKERSAPTRPIWPSCWKVRILRLDMREGGDADTVNDEMMRKLFVLPKT